MNASPADVARAYVRAIETCAPEETFRTLLHEDVVIEILPNRIAPSGGTPSFHLET